MNCPVNVDGAGVEAWDAGADVDEEVENAKPDWGSDDEVADVTPPLAVPELPAPLDDPVTPVVAPPGNAGPLGWE